MSLYICSLNSGSNGNCYYIGTETDAVLVDAGLSCLETEKRMKRLDLPLSRVRAIFVSHEHTDHIRGIPVLSAKYRLPVYISPRTLHFSGITIEKDLNRQFTENEPITFGDLSVRAFRKIHDASEPYSFVISCKGTTVGVFTDIGTICEQLILHFRQCHAAFLEANYDEDLLEKGSYPYYLKNRIRGGKGHLSNTQSLGLFTAHRPAFMSHLLLSHLSKANNSPKHVEDAFHPCSDGVRIVIASRFKETEVFHICKEYTPKSLYGQITEEPVRIPRTVQTQLSLFA